MNEQELIEELGKEMKKIVDINEEGTPRRLEIDAAWPQKIAVDFPASFFVGLMVGFTGGGIFGMFFLAVLIILRRAFG